MRIEPLIFVTITLAVLAGALYLSSSGEFVSWQVDLPRAYRYDFPTERVRSYEITLVNKAGGDSTVGVCSPGVIFGFGEAVDESDPNSRSLFTLPGFGGNP